MNSPKVDIKPCFLTPKQIKPEYPLFIYLPGMDGTGQLLRTQTAGLEAGFDVRCLAIPREDLTTWEDLAKNVLELIQAELNNTPGRKVYLCGESFGGCLAQKVAVAAPNLFERIILINSASAIKLRPWLSWAAGLTDLTPELFFDLGAVGLLPFLASLGRMSASDRQELLSAMRSVPAATVRWRISLLNEFHVNDKQLRRLTPPVLIIAGASDRLLPSTTEAKRLAEIIPHSKLLILPESGHACLLETNTNLYQIMQDNHFLDSIYEQ